MNLKETFLAKLRKKLNANQRKMLSLIEVIGVGRKSLVFQMPTGVIALDGVWEKISELSQQMEIEVSHTSGNYATLEDLDKILGNIEWLWNRWVPRGFVTMVAGDPGVGKSAIVQHLVKIITCGESFPMEEEKVKPQNVIWIDTEASQQILKVRAHSMGIAKSRVYIPSIMGDMLTQPDLAINENRQYILNMVQDVKPALLVLDSLGGSHTRGENKVEDIRPILEFKALLARDYQIATIVIHHLNKGRTDETPEVSLYRIRGSTVIPAMCRSIFAIEPTHDKLLKLRMVKSNLAQFSKDEAISVIPLLSTDGDFRGFEYDAYTPPPAKKNKKEVVADWVLTQLNSHEEGMYLSDLVELGDSIGFTRQNIYAARDVLGERILYGGTGNKAFWYTPKEDKRVLNQVKAAVSGTNGKHPTKEKKDDKSKRSTAAKPSGRRAGKQPVNR